jgi:protease-4
MKPRDKLLVAAILAAPIVIGLFLYIGESADNAALVAGNPLKKIGLVRVINEIISAEDYVRQLRELREDKSVAGVLLRVDSPGGAVAPSQEIFSEVLRYRAQSKPLIVSMGSVAASGGYYIASPATRIFADPGTITGSIGVIMRFPQYYRLMDKIGVKMETIKSGTFKDVGSPDRDMTPRERGYLQQFIDDTYDQFIEDVANARGMDIDTVRTLAEGRIYTGRQAITVGLIDTLGGFQDALDYLRESLNLPEKTKVLEKRRHGDFLSDFLAEELFDKIPLIRSLRPQPGSYFILDNY